jgi:phage-related minor tail protein
MASAGELTARIALGGMDAVERSLKGFSRAMDRVAKDAQEMGDKLKNAGDGIKGFGEDLSGVTAGLAGLGAVGIVASNEIETAINGFQTKLGASGKDLEMYQGVMNDVAKTGVGSFTEVSDAVVTVANNMKGLSPDELTMLTEEAMQLASVMGSDTTEVTKTAGILMKQFGVEGAEAMDLIAKGYQNGMDFAGDYQDTLGEYSVYFSQMGFSAEDMFNTLISGAEAGAFNLDKVGDAVKEFGIRSKDGSDTSREAFEALGMDADKMTQIFAKGGEGAKKSYGDVVQALAGVDDQAKRNAIGVALFGTQYEDMEADVIASTGSVVDHMKNVEGASAEVAQNNVTFGQQMQGAWNEIQTAIKPVGDVLKDAILTVMPLIINAVKGLSEAFTSLSPTGQKVVMAIAGIVALLPILLMGIGSVVGVFGTLMTGFGTVAKGFSLLATAGTKVIGGLKKIGTAFNALRILFMTNPFLLIATAIVALVILIVMNWDKVKAVTIAVFTAIGSFFASVWEGIKAVAQVVIDALIAGWNSFKAGFMAVLTAVGSFFVGIWNGLKAVFLTVWNFYVAYITTVFNIIKTIVQTAWNVIKTIFLIALGIIITLLAPLWNAFVTGWNFIVDLVTIVVGKIKTFISGMVTALMGYWNTFKAGVQAIWNFIVANVITPIVNKIKSIITTLIAKATEIMNKIKSIFTAVWNFIYSNIISPVIAKVKAIVGTIVAFIQNVLNRVKQGWTNIFNAIRNLVQSVINKIKSIIDSIRSKVTTVVNNVKSTFSNAFNSIKSKVTGAIDSIINKVQGIWNKAKTVASNIKSAFSGLFKGIKVPSFSMGGWKMSDLPKLPKMKINWNASGGILDSATFIGAGEKGTESIVPLASQRKMKPFAQAVSRFMPEKASGGSGKTEINIAQLVVREDADVERIAKELNKLQERKERARGGLSFNG